MNESDPTRPVERFSRLVCPGCGVARAMEMPIDACQLFHTCDQCGETFGRKPGDCCVFCSYGSVPCPPVQQAGRGG